MVNRPGFLVKTSTPVQSHSLSAGISRLPKNSRNDVNAAERGRLAVVSAGDKSAGTAGEAALWGGSIAVMAMAANPLGAHQDSRIFAGRTDRTGVPARNSADTPAFRNRDDEIDYLRRTIYLREVDLFMQALTAADRFSIRI
jgi:hypothetical protein